MKLVCFPNNAAGGLVCDLLNQRNVSMAGYQTTSQEHSTFKLNDNPAVQWQVNPVQWYLRCNEFRGQSGWFGTHCHPTGIPNLQQFDEVIAITVITRLSKLYRWLRCYYGYFLKENQNWKETQNMDSIDTVREFAKIVFESFPCSDNCKNVEFEDIVNGKFVTDNNLDLLQYQQWQLANSFLYSFKETDWCVQRFVEAEFEINNNEPWKYY